DGIRDFHVTGVQTCALPILGGDLVLHHALSVPPGLTYVNHDAQENHKISRSYDQFVRLTDVNHNSYAGTHGRTEPRPPHPRPRRSEERRVGTEGRRPGGEVS